MRHPRLAAVRNAVVVSALIAGAACAHAQAASSFEVLARREPVRATHRAAYACALAGAGLIAASFPLTDAADRRYADYLREADPGRIESRWTASVRADRLSSGALLGGEALLVTAAYLRFLRPAHEARVAVVVTPERCALSCRF